MSILDENNAAAAVGKTVEVLALSGVLLCCIPHNIGAYDAALFPLLHMLPLFLIHYNQQNALRLLFNPMLLLLFLWLSPQGTRHLETTASSSTDSSRILTRCVRTFVPPNATAAL